MSKERNCLTVATEKAKTNMAPSQEAAISAAEPDWLRPLVEMIVGEVTAKPPRPTPFCDFAALVRHLPMYGERTLRQLVKDKIIPALRPPGSRKLAFHLPSVEASLLRYQKGGIEAEGMIARAA